MNRNPLRGRNLLTQCTKYIKQDKTRQDKTRQDDSNEKVSLIYIGDKEVQLSLMDSIDINNIKCPI